MDIVRIPIDELTPDPTNAKDHPEWQGEQIVNSIEQFGNLDPIGVWGDDNLIVEGHGRYEALKRLGYQEAECIRLDWLTEEERSAYALAHNKLTMNSGFIPEALDLNLDAIGEIDMGLFGFRGGNWFSDRQRDDDSRQDGNDEYNEFLDKFEQPKTTDDCYTPDIVYDAVANWVAENYDVKREKMVRPFYPNGDYQREKYEDGCVVVDNPPFSILSQIIKFYQRIGVAFFLFAPTLTLFSSSSSCTAICVGASITYDNGACVNTSFLTNLEPGTRLRSAPKLYEAVKQANEENQRAIKKELPSYSYPDYVVTATRVAKFSQLGIDFAAPVSETAHIRQMDAQKKKW